MVFSPTHAPLFAASKQHVNVRVRRGYTPREWKLRDLRWWVFFPSRKTYSRARIKSAPNLLFDLFAVSWMYIIYHYLCLSRIRFWKFLLWPHGVSFWSECGQMSLRRVLISIDRDVWLLIHLGGFTFIIFIRCRKCNLFTDCTEKILFFFSKLRNLTWSIQWNGLFSENPTQQTKWIHLSENKGDSTYLDLLQRNICVKDGGNSIYSPSAW